MTDTELIAKISVRDRKAFDSIYDRYASVLFSFCLRILKQKAEAEDVLQEIFVQVWRDAPRFDPRRGSPRSWLFTIARSRALDRYRSRKIAQNRMEEETSAAINGISSQEDLQSTRIRNQYVAKALNKLTRKQRMVLEMLYYEGFTQEEISERLAEPVGTIKSRVRSALIALRFHFNKRREKKPGKRKL
ncbi:sigma-70 family RNA polymerase sigma factor [bacterium]|nr:sigma-70 family RNA polymerase sigma factor [bacterium]